MAKFVKICYPTLPAGLPSSNLLHKTHFAPYCLDVVVLQHIFIGGVIDSDTNVGGAAGGTLS
jgi:hypothetical protein